MLEQKKTDAILCLSALRQFHGVPPAKEKNTIGTDRFCSIRVQANTLNIEACIRYGVAPRFIKAWFGGIHLEPKDGSAERPTFWLEDYPAFAALSTISTTAADTPTNSEVRRYPSPLRHIPCQRNRPE